MTTRELFSFPNPVNEKAARSVAGGVVLLAAGSGLGELLAEGVEGVEGAAAPGAVAGSSETCRVSPVMCRSPERVNASRSSAGSLRSGAGVRLMQAGSDFS
jgi:hypothetical protein